MMKNLPENQQLELSEAIAIVSFDYSFENIDELARDDTESPKSHEVLRPYHGMTADQILTAAAEFRKTLEQQEELRRKLDFYQDPKNRNPT